VVGLVSTLKLRDYQTGAIDAVLAAWAGGMQTPAVVLPTGMGKTVIFADLILRLVRAGRRPLVLVHRDELATQTQDKLHDADPSLRVGVIKATRNEYGTDFDVVIGSVQTLGRPARLSPIERDQFTDVIVDECHHAAADSYVRILSWFGCLNYAEWNAVNLLDQTVSARPEWPRAVGFTATMERGDDRKLGKIWSDVVYRKDIMYGILNGYLVDVSGIQVTVDGLDLASVARSKGDYQDGALGNALEDAGAGEAIATAYIEHCALPCTCANPDRHSETHELMENQAGRLFRRRFGCPDAPVKYRQALLFAPTVATAESFAESLVDAGIRAQVITGTTSKEERTLIYKRYRAHEIDVIASCMVLTEGFDMPQAEVAIIARPTSSSALYVQMVGRVLRPSPRTGKTSALVLDVVGVTSRLALASIADLTGGEVTPAPGETLTQAQARQQARPEQLVPGTVQGEIAYQAVNLFQQSKSAWLQTHAGVWFIPTRECLVFLWSAPAEDGTERFKLCRSKDPYTAKGGAYLKGGEAFSLDYAMAWAEQEASELDPSVSSRKSSWRQKSRVPSTAQIEQCDKNMITVPEGANKSQVSDLLSIHFASRALDRGVKRPGSRR